MAATIQQTPFLCEDGEILHSDDSVTSVPAALLDSNDALCNSSVPLLSSNVVCGESSDDRYDYGSGRDNKPHSDCIALNEPMRFWQLVVCTFCCLAISTSYASNLYSGQLQSKYNFSQNDMTAISTTADIVGGMTLPFGALYDYYGVSCTFLSALLTLPLGFFFFGLTFANVIEGSVPAFAVYGSLQSIGISLLDMSAVMTMLSVFPADRGAVVAVMKTFSGMGSAILGAIHLAFFSADTDSDASRFFYFLTVLTALATFLGVLFVHVPPYIICGYEAKKLTADQRRARQRIKEVYLSRRAPLSRFAVGFAIVVFLMIFLPLQGALSVYLDLSYTWHVVFALIAVGVFACYPIMALPLKIFERTEDDESKSDLSSDDDAFDTVGRTSRISRISRKLAGTSRAIRASRLSRAIRASNRDSISSARLRELEFAAPQYQTTIVQNLATVRMWSLIWTLFVLFGSNIIILGNTRFLFAALSNKLLDNSLMALIVIILGVGSGVGRIILSIVEAFTQNVPAEKRIPITFVLLIPIVLTILSLLLMLSAPPSALPLAAVLIALGNGSTAAAVVIVLRTIYANDVAKLYNVAMMAVPLSSVIMNRLLYAEWYTREAEKQGSKICLGRHCVLMPLLVCLGMVFTAFLSTLYLHWDYSQLCKKMIELRRHKLNRESGERNISLSPVDDPSLFDAQTVSKEDKPGT